MSAQQLEGGVRVVFIRAACRLEREVGSMVA
jgi:hypothetical protein